MQTEEKSKPQCFEHYLELDSPQQQETGLCSERCPVREACWRATKVRKEVKDGARR